MKKFTPNGQKIKQLRSELEKYATQKEFSHMIGVSERYLREIENANAAIPAPTLDRLAKLLNVSRDQVVFSLDTPKLVASNPEPTTVPMGDFLTGLDKDEFIPRYGEDIAQVTMDEAQLFKDATSSSDVSCLIHTPLTPETSEYGQEFFEILISLSHVKRGWGNPVPAEEELATRRRIRQLLVLLRGNDVWVYQSTMFRTLPEKEHLPPDDEPSRLEYRLNVALGPAGEYGETSIRIPVDHGQPFILKGWDFSKVGEKLK